MQTHKGSEGSFTLYETAPIAAVHHDWIAGPYVKTDTGESLVESFEVKRGIISAEEGVLEWKQYASGKTWQLIMRGSVECFFLLDGKEEMVVQHAGEALLWDNTIPHRTHVLEEVEYICVRTST